MQSQTVQLKAMSFNIRYGTANDGENSWPLRKDAVIEFIGDCGYDVIGLQEALCGQLEEVRSALPHYHFVGVGRDDGLTDGEYSAVLFDSRRVEVESSDTFWFSETPEVIASTSWGNTLTRICTHGSFRVEGLPFEFYNLHLDHASAISRLKSVELLVQRIRSRGATVPTIVTGDFNEGEADPTIALMLKSGFIDTYRALYADGPEQATCHEWTGAILGQKIDYVFVDGIVTIVDSGIIRENPYRGMLSDHYPVVATLAL